MNWITRWKKIGIKVKQIFKKQPTGHEETDWKACPQCKKISYKPDLLVNSYICECSFHFDLPPKQRLDSLFLSCYLYQLRGSRDLLDDTVRTMF